MRISLHIQPASQSLGGAEIMVAHIAAMLRSHHDVEVVHHRSWLEVGQLAEFAGVDLQGVTGRYIERRRTYFFSDSSNPVTSYRERRRWGRELGEGCDLFLTVTHELPAFHPAPRGILFVLFPMSSPLDAWPFAVAKGREALRTRLSRAFHLREYSALWRRYDLKLAISDFTATWARHRWGIECAVLNPVVDCPALDAAKEDVILTLGRFSVSGVSKEQERMAVAFARAGSDLESWRLVCVGGAGTEAEIAYAERVRAKGERIEVVTNAPRVEVSGWLGKARVFWHAAGMSEDATLHPDRLEHFGIATVEAMANGCVPVVVNRGGQPEIVEHGVSGFLCSSLDEMVSRTVQLSRDPELWTRMSSAARGRAAAFGLDSFQRRFEALAPWLFDPARTRASAKEPA